MDKIIKSAPNSNKYISRMNLNTRKLSNWTLVRSNKNLPDIYVHSSSEGIPGQISVSPGIKPTEEDSNIHRFAYNHNGGLYSITPEGDLRVLRLSVHHKNLDNLINGLYENFPEYMIDKDESWPGTTSKMIKMYRIPNLVELHMDKF